VESDFDPDLQSVNMDDMLSTGVTVQSSIANGSSRSRSRMEEEEEDDSINVLSYSDLQLVNDSNQNVNATAASVINHSNDGFNRLATKQWSKSVNSLLQPSRSAFLLLHGPAITLLLTLIARLFAADNFQSQPASFDFGPKYGRIQSDGSFDTNIAFGPEFNSVGHSIQGLVAALLPFPAVSGLIARKIGRLGMRGKQATVDFSNVRVVLSLITLIYSLLTVYPTYNLFKRINGKGYPAFASTSYANNGMEWSTGYALGLAVGLLLTAITRKRLILVYPVNHEGGLEGFMKTFDVHYTGDFVGDGREDEETIEQSFSEEFVDHVVWGKDEDLESVSTSRACRPRHVILDKDLTIYVFGKLDDYTATPSKSKRSVTSLPTILYNIYFMDCFTVMKVVSNFLLLLFTISTLLCGIYMGKTWNKCSENDGDECINSTTNGVDVGSSLTVIFIFTFIAIQSAFIAISIRMHGLRI